MSDYHVRPTSRDQQSPRARSLRSRSSSRDMSWRKPVPKFIPSPPISPNQGLLQQHTSSPTSTTFGYTMDRANPFSMSLVSLNHDLPPLPVDWRENIDRVIRNESTTNLKSLKTPPITPVHASPTHGLTHGYHHAAAASQFHITEVDRDQSTFQEVDLGEVKSRNRHRSADKENVPPSGVNHGSKGLAVSPATNASTVSISRIPKAFRPPTPPRPSSKKTSVPPTPITTTMIKPMHIVFPDQTSLGAETHSQRTKSPDDDTTDTRTLRTARSSLTMWTDTRGTSADSDDDDRTLPVYQPHSARKSTIGSKTMFMIDPHNPRSGFWKTLKHWFDSLLNSFKSCLSGY